MRLFSTRFRRPVRGDEIKSQSTIFQQKEGGIHTYRIPALQVLPDNVVLAFAEARKFSGSDFEKTALAMKRSTDGGQSWGPLQILWDNGEAIQNPCPVYDAITGELFLHTIVDRRDHYLQRSRDAGLTWSAPEHLQLRKSHWTCAGPCPAHAVQLASGRLLIPGMYNVGDAKSDKDWGSYFVKSDDHGQTWQLAHDFGEGTNEFTFAERADHVLYSIFRPNQRIPSPFTRYSLSENGGDTWSPLTPHPDLGGTICEASLLQLRYFPDPQIKPLLYAKPAHPDQRFQLTIKYSLDGGTRWQSLLTLTKGRSGYSDLAELPDGTVLCLIEQGRRVYREKLVLYRLHLHPVGDGLIGDFIAGRTSQDQ